MLKSVLLSYRGVVRVSGADARSFLEGLITNSMSRVSPGQAIHAALLTPQGKIIADFFLTEAIEEGGFILDLPWAAAADVVKRLTLYKLRAKVVIENLSDSTSVLALWGDGFDPGRYDLAYADPRSPAGGWRLVVPRAEAEAIAAELGATAADRDAFDAFRIALGLPEPLFDYPLNETFPHEINMDQINGVDFRKGCYVGQEVVSRMQHRGTARTRMILLRTQNGFTIDEGAEVTAGERSIGRVGGGADGLNLALIRLDRMAEALAEGVPILAGGMAVHPVKPPWWHIDWPFASEGPQGGPSAVPSEGASGSGEATARNPE